MFQAIILWIIASSLAAFLASLDTAGRYPEPPTVFSTKEWWILWITNVILAFVVIFSAYLMGRVELTFISFFAVIFGYPLLLHSKLFTLRGTSPEEDKSFGPEFVLQIAEKILLPGISESIQENGAKLLHKWRAIDIRILGSTTKDYITSHKLPDGYKRTKEDTIKWIDNLVSDAKANPKQTDANKRSLFSTVEIIGKYRGIRWVLAQATNRAEKTSTHN
jgi:hypothetical protein